MSHHQAYTSRTTVFFSFCLTVFRAIALGIPFALQIRITVCMVLGAHCCSYSGVGFANPRSYLENFCFVDGKYIVIYNK